MSSLQEATIRITAFDWVPDFAQGKVRDLRLRWALEEAGLSYEVILLGQGTQGGPDNIARQPFGQVPAIEIDGCTMFESGAVVWKIAQTSPELLPEEEGARDAVLSWIFAALNSVEPSLSALAELDFFQSDEEVKAKCRPGAISEVKLRLGQLQDALGDRDYLVACRFTAADLMMATVLRMAEHDEILRDLPRLGDYLKRVTERPAFKRALADQLEPFAENAARYESAA